MKDCEWCIRKLAISELAKCLSFLVRRKGFLEHTDVTDVVSSVPLECLRGQICDTVRSDGQVLGLEDERQSNLAECVANTRDTD